MAILVVIKVLTSKKEKITTQIIGLNGVARTAMHNQDFINKYIKLSDSQRNHFLSLAASGYQLDCEEHDGVFSYSMKNVLTNQSVYMFDT